MTTRREGARVGIITNPGSQKNKRGLGEMLRLAEAAPHARQVVLNDIAEVPGILADFAREGIEVLAIAGGDGTVQAVLTELYGKRPFAELPLLAVVPRGMTNMIADDVGLKGRGLAGLERLLAATPAELAAATRRRRILRAENILNREPQYGMFFGGAGICRAMEACRTQVHSRKLEGNAAAAVTLAGVLGGWLLGFGKAKTDSRERIFYGDSITMTLDDGHSETRDSLVILATTLHKLILGSRPFWGGGHGHLRFTAIGYPPRKLLRYAWRILYGSEARQLPAASYLSRSSDRVALAMDCPFTLDGEIFEPMPDRELILTAADEARFVRI